MLVLWKWQISGQAKQEKERTEHLTISGMKEGVITTDPTDSKRIIREHYKQFYKSKFNNLDKMDFLIWWHKLPKYIGKAEMDNLNSFIIFIEEVEEAVKNLPKKKNKENSWPTWFHQWIFKNIYIKIN